MKKDRWISPRTLESERLHLSASEFPVERIVEARFNVDGEPHGATIFLDFLQSGPGEALVTEAFERLRSEGCEGLSIDVRMDDDLVYDGLSARGDRDLTPMELVEAHRIARSVVEKRRAAAAAQLTAIQEEFPDLAPGRA